MRRIAPLAMIAIIILSSSAAAFQAFSGTTVNINTPIEDDVFASGSIINIDAPVSSATVVGGTIIINAPIAGDLIAAGGQVTVNSDIGGKLIAFGGNLNLAGNVSKNAVLGGGHIDIQTGKVIGKDLLAFGGTVINAAAIRGNLTVSASTFENTGSARSIEFKQIKTSKEEPEYPFSPFALVMALGYLLAGLIFLRLFPALFSAIDLEVKDSTIVKAVVGFVLLISSAILVFMIAITVVGIPMALILTMLLIVAVMLSGVFVSFSLGKAIFDMLKVRTSDLAVFLVGFLILNALFHVPYAGWFVKLLAVSLGFGAILYALKTNWSALSHPP